MNVAKVANVAEDGEKGEKVDCPIVADEELGVLLTYGFVDEVISCTDEMAANLELLLKNPGVLLMRLAALHNQNRITELGTVLPKTRQAALLLDEEAFTAWCLMGLDCGAVDMVQDSIMSYMDNEIIKFGKQRAGCNDNIPRRPLISSLYALEIMSRHSHNFDGAIEWVDSSILLSDEHKKILSTKVNEMRHSISQGTNSKGIANADINSSSSSLADKRTTRMSFSWRESLRDRSAMAVQDDQTSSRLFGSTFIIGVGGVALLLIAVSKRNHIRQSTKSIWAVVKEKSLLLKAAVRRW